MDYDCEIDTRHDNCPVPVIKAHRAMKNMAPSQVIKILAVQDSTRNFEAFARSARYLVVRKDVLGSNGLEILIQKTARR